MLQPWNFPWGVGERLTLLPVYLALFTMTNLLDKSVSSFFFFLQNSLVEYCSK